MKCKVILSLNYKLKIIRLASTASMTLPQELPGMASQENEHKQNRGGGGGENFRNTESTARVERLKNKKKKSKKETKGSVLDTDRGEKTSQK